MRTDDSADMRFNAMLENYIFYISRMYEFSHSLDPERPFATVNWRAAKGSFALDVGALGQIWCNG